MKAITIKNPWAHLIAIGVKDVENRSWKTKYRGTVLIHAAQTMDHRYREMSHLFTSEQFRSLSIKEQSKAVVGIYPMSAVIGEVEIVDCINDSQSIWAEEGQWHWILKNATIYDEPILNVKGKLSFWEYDPCKHSSQDLSPCEMIVRYCICREVTSASANIDCRWECKTCGGVIQ